MKQLIQNSILPNSPPANLPTLRRRSKPKREATKTRRRPKRSPKLIYDALAASNEREASSPYVSKNVEGSRNGQVLEGVTAMAYKDSINYIIEEYTRLKTQARSLARGLAGREEEVQLLIEELEK